MHIALAIISNNRLGPLAIPLVTLNVNAEATIHLESQQHFVINRISASRVRRSISFHALELKLAQTGLQVRSGESETFRIGFSVGSGLCRAELEGVETGNVGSVIGG
jgi:hypothetical protein